MSEQDHTELRFDATGAQDLYLRALGGLAEQVTNLSNTHIADPATARLVRSMADTAVALAESVAGIHGGLTGLADLAEGHELVKRRVRPAGAIETEPPADANFYDDALLCDSPATEPDTKLPLIEVERVGPLMLGINGQLIRLTEDEAYCWRALVAYREQWVTGRTMRAHGFDERQEVLGRTPARNVFGEVMNSLTRKISQVVSIVPFQVRGTANATRYRLNANIASIDHRSAPEDADDRDGE